MFFPVEKHNNGKFACTGRTELFPSNKLTRWLWKDKELPVCAHRTLPCGTWVWVENPKTDKGAWCVVGDRGPYGATTPSGKWVLKTASKRKQYLNANYRNLIDLGPAVANKVGTNGWSKVRIYWWPEERRGEWFKNRVVELESTFVEEWH